MISVGTFISADGCWRQRCSFRINVFWYNLTNSAVTFIFFAVIFVHLIFSGKILTFLFRVCSERLIMSFAFFINIVKYQCSPFPWWCFLCFSHIVSPFSPKKGIKITPSLWTVVLIDQMLLKVIKYNLVRVIFYHFELVISGWLFFIYSINNLFSNEKDHTLLWGSKFNNQ